tara:strand:+ start:220 stop:762 length:543 start_codon:yes stop_codon:yes gene_type:complete
VTVEKEQYLNFNFSRNNLFFNCVSESLKISKFYMKTIISTLLLFVSLPVNAYESVGNHSNFKEYESRKGYAHETKCYRYEYREHYFPGNSISPGYVKSYKEKVSVPCNRHSSVSNHYHQKIKPQTSYLKYEPVRKCTGSTTLGGLIGGGLAATLSKKDAYGWTIPLGAVLGAGIGNAECN